MKKPSKISKKKIIEFLRPYAKDQFTILICVILGAILNLQYPLIIKILVDDVIINKNEKMLIIMVIIYAASILIGDLILFLTRFMNALTARLFTFDLKKRVFTHMHNLPLDFFNKTGMGEIISNFSRDVNTITNLLSASLLGILKNIFSIFVTATILLFLNWKLALLIFMVLPFYCFSFLSVKGATQKNSERNRQIVTEENRLLQNTFSNIKLTKLFACQKQMLKRFLSVQSRLINSSIRTMVTNSLLYEIISIISLVGYLIVIWYGIKLVYTAELSIGGFMSFYTFLPYLFGPIQSLGSMNGEIRDFVVSFNRITHYLDMPPERNIISHQKITRGDIEYDRVVFGYNENAVLKGVNIKVKSGEKIALMGKNGSGKTTLCNLLLGLYNTKNGSISIDGIDITKLSVNYLRKNVGIVTQEINFYNLSIEDNLRASNYFCNKEDIIKACKLSGAHDFIEKLSDQYDTVIGEKGYNLSGGQLQKLAIARLILKAPKIIIFDEATSALDYESSLNFYSHFETTFKDCTILFIIHDIRNIVYADKVLYLNKGVIEREYLKSDLHANDELIKLLSNTLED